MVDAEKIMIGGVVLLIAMHVYGKFMSGRREPRALNAVGGPGDDTSLVEWLDALTKPFMKVLISVGVLGAALYIIVFMHDAETSVKDWAYAAAGTIVGFWLKI
ncbi:hypothetical protein SB778_03480 [Paraburkholderia sp. SIMBA_050]